MTLRLVAGKFKGRALKTPTGPLTRPTQGMLREAVFNICQMEIGGARFLDLFAGSGAIGFEALSRGAAHVVFVEQNKKAISCIKENIQALQVTNEVTLLMQDSLRALQLLENQGAQFDLIYIDPPYALKFDLDALKAIAAPGAVCFLEERKNSHPPQSASWAIRNTRIFGIAQLTIYDRLEGLGQVKRPAQE